MFGTSNYYGALVTVTHGALVTVSHEALITITYGEFIAITESITNTYAAFITITYGALIATMYGSLIITYAHRVSTTITHGALPTHHLRCGCKSLNASFRWKKLCNSLHHLGDTAALRTGSPKLAKRRRGNDFGVGILPQTAQHSKAQRSAGQHRAAARCCYCCCRRCRLRYPQANRVPDPLSFSAPLPKPAAVVCCGTKLEKKQ